MKNFGIKGDTTLDFLNGQVSSVKTVTNDIKDGEAEQTDHSYREYDKKGNRTLSIHYDDNDAVRLKQVSQFDSSGKKIGYVNYDKYDRQDSYGKYQYDYNGKMTAKYHDGTCEEQYEYDGKGNVAQVYYPNTGGRDLYEYDLNNLATKQLSKKGENSLFGSLFGGPKNKLTIFTNDKFGNIIEMKVYDGDTKELLFTQKNTANDKGDEIESIGYNADGSVYSHVKYNYQYDNNDNWILKQTLTKDGKVYRENKRQIKYHSDIGKTAVTQTLETPFKKKRLNGQQLALLYIALSKKLFSKPTNTELFYEGHNDGSCTLYFQKDYYQKLCSSISQAYNAGKFAQSNSEDDWNNLKYTIDNADGVDNVDTNKLQVYQV